MPGRIRKSIPSSASAPTRSRIQAQQAVRQELKGEYKTWLDQEVPYIISDEERKAFKALSNDEERDAFIEQFWLRRNPNPDSPENEFREEHYRRIAYANDRFAAGKPGWKTDRGHIYISFGAPDSIDSHPSGGSYQRPMEEGGGETSTFPFEIWHYRYIEGIGENVDIEFVDTCQCGDYHFTIDRGEKDALAKVPGAGLTQWEEMGQAKKADRFKGGFENLGTGPLSSGQASKEFDRIELAAKLFAPPPVKFKDLDNFISEHKLLNGPIFPFDVRTDFVKVTESMVLVPITVQIRNRDITFVTKDGVSKGYVNILGKVTTIMHKTVQTFEDTVEVEQPAELLEKSLDRQSVYWKAIPVTPGLYRLDIAIKDVNNPDHVGIYGRGIEVPTYRDEKLATSSLILADQMSQVSSREIGAGKFVIGNTLCAAARQPQPGHAGQLQAQPGAQFLDAGLQSRHRRGDQEQRGHGRLSDRRHGDQHRDPGKAARIEGLGSAQRPVDGGEKSAHRRVAAGPVQGQHQNKRHNLETRDCAIGPFCRRIEVTPQRELTGHRNSAAARDRTWRVSPGTPTDCTLP